MCPPVPPPAMMTESGREAGDTGRGESLASAPFIFVSSNSLISNSLCLQSHYGTYGTYAFPRLPVSMSPCLLVSLSLFLLLNPLLRYVQQDSDRRKCGDQR